MSDTLRSKKIAVLVPTLRYGGGERVATNIINGLCRYLDLEVFPIIYSDQIDYEIDSNANIVILDEKTDIKSFLEKSVSMLRKIFKLRKAIRKNNITHIISIMPSMNIISLLATSRIDIKVIISEHNVINYDKSIVTYITNLLKRLTYKHANQVICVSKGVSDSLSKLIPSIEYKVIYNPLDLQDIINKSKEKLPKKFESYILGVGRLHKQKGFDLLIKTYSRLNSDINLLILGDGNEKDHLLSLIHELNLSEKVNIIGFQENPYKFMKNAEAFILSSRWEGFGMVLAEALTINNKVVSYDCKSGPSEILMDGEIGLLAEPENIDDLKNKIEKILTSKKSFSREKIDRRLKDFDINNVINQYYVLLS